MRQTPEFLSLVPSRRENVHMKLQRCAGNEFGVTFFTRRRANLGGTTSSI